MDHFTAVSGYSVTLRKQSQTKQLSKQETILILSSHSRRTYAGYGVYGEQQNVANNGSDGEEVGQEVHHGVKRDEPRPLVAALPLLLLFLMVPLVFVAMTTAGIARRPHPVNTRRAEFSAV